VLEHDAHGQRMDGGYGLVHCVMYGESLLSLLEEFEEATEEEQDRQWTTRI